MGSIDSFIIAFHGNLKPILYINYTEKLPPIQQALGHFIHVFVQLVHLENKPDVMQVRRMRSKKHMLST